MNLISILLALFLSSLIIAGTLQWYEVVKQQWEKFQKRKIDQEMQKVIFQFIYQDLQAAGYRGPRTKDNHFPLYHHYSNYTAAHRYFCWDKIVFGFVASPGNCFGKMPYTACERQCENTEALIIYNVPQVSANITAPMTQLDDALITSGIIGLQENSLMMVSDHEQGDVFIATGIQDNILHHRKMLGKNDTAEFSKLYTQNADVVELQTVAYYLGVTERAKNVPLAERKRSYALYRDDFLHPAQELISGIRSVQFSYGAAETEGENTNIKTMQCNEVKDWNAIKQVRVKVVTETGTTWETTIVLRNTFQPKDKKDKTSGFKEGKYWREGSKE